MKAILTIAFLSFTTALLAGGEGIQFFEGTLKEAKELAAKEHKIIFIDAYTSWCGPCKRMAKDVFTQESVGNFYNKHFINMKIDMEKGEGPKVASKYSVRSYPTFLFIDEKGAIVHQAKGGRPAEQFIGIGKQALLQNDKSDEYKVKYDEGERDPALLMAYARELQRSAKPSQKIANEYIRTQKDFTTKENIDFLYEAALDSDSKIFELMVQHKEQVIAQKGEESYYDKVKAACDATVAKAVEFKVESLVGEAKKQMKIAHPKFAKEYSALADINYQKGMKQFDGLEKNIDKYLKKYAKKDADKWHNQAKYMVRVAPNYKLLNKAEEWVKKAISIEDKPDYQKTQIELLRRQGKTEEVLELMKKTENLKKN